MSIVGAGFLDSFSGEEWMRGAVCPQVDAEIFFPDKGNSAAPAKRICFSCPVRSECLEYAFRHHIREGIFGGFSRKERERLNIGGNPMRRPGRPARRSA